MYIDYLPLNGIYRSENPLMGLITERISKMANTSAVSLWQHLASKVAPENLKMPPASIGPHVLTVRMCSGLSRPTLSRLVGVTAQTIMGWENGSTRAVSPVWVKPLANALNDPKLAELAAQIAPHMFEIEGRHAAKTFIETGELPMSNAELAKAIDGLLDKKPLTLAEQLALEVGPDDDDGPAVDFDIPD